MAEVRCWAIGIDEVREIFSAAPALRTRLLEVSAELTAPVSLPPPQPGLLGKLGPLFRKAPDAPVLTPGAPTLADAMDLTQGRFVSAPRLAPSWALVRRWLDALAWDSAHWDLTDRELDALDFDLARAGVVSHHGVRHLWGRDARLTLRALPGTQVGYLRHDAALALAEDWARAVPQLDVGSSRTVTEAVSFLERLRSYGETATGAGRPTPDVVTLRTS